VSLKTGEAVLKALRSRGYEAVAIDVDRDVAQVLVREWIDVAFIALHGRFGEDGVIQGVLEMMGLPYTGSGVLASALAMDKIFSKKIFAQSRLDIAPYVVVRRGESPDPASFGFEFPVVVKPSREGSSVGVSIVKREEDLAEALATAFRYDREALVEKFVKGREIQVGILEEKAVGVIEIVPKNEFYDFEAKYVAGMAEHIIPPPGLSPGLYQKILDVGVAAHKNLGCCGYSRVDLLVNESGTCYVLEVNTLPGMTATSLLPEIAQWAGIPFEDLVERILATAFTREGA
jgi:D-alanine-D-alanine ligase